MNVELSRAFDLIKWDRTQEEQEKGIKMANKIEIIEEFILPVYPMYNKNVWGNCAKILSNKTDAELTPYLDKILEWLQDLNWPGTYVIIERLSHFESSLLLKPYISAINKAKITDEQEWYKHLTVLIKNESLLKKLPTVLSEEIYKAYKDFWQ